MIIYKRKDNVQMKTKYGKIMWHKILIACFLSVNLITGSLLLSFTECRVQAATFEEINQNSVFLKQARGSNTCTLVSSTMMLRRAAMMRGDADWSSITETALRPVAWLEGTGLYHQFTYKGLKVGYGTFDGKESTLINLLKQHPEGIEIYDRAIPHAILITDYTNGVFYCADPSPGVASGRIPVSKASVTISGADNYWYVASPAVSLTPSDTSAPTVSNYQITNVSKDGYTVTCEVNDNVGVTKVYFPTWTEKDGQDDIIWGEGSINGNTASYTVSASSHNYEEGIYLTHVYAQDAAGNLSSAAGGSVFIDRTPPVISEVQVLSQNSTGYVVQCTVTDNRGVVRVQFPTWTELNGQDDIIPDWGINSSCSGIIKGNTAAYQVLRSAHNNEAGLYNTHIYAFDSCGNSASVPLQIILDSTAEQRKTGDVDGNSVIDLTDAQLALKMALGILTGTDQEQITAADINKNGVVELSDANWILKAALGIIS